MMHRLFSKNYLKVAVEDNDDETQSKNRILQLKQKYNTLLTKLIDLEFELYAEEILFLQKRINK